MSKQPVDYAGTVNKLEFRIHDFYDILNIDGEFKVDDLEGLHTDSNAIRLLAENGALKKIRKVYPDCNSHSRGAINVWEWKQRYQARLQDYWNQMEKLPCGHRPNIFNCRKVPKNKLSCRYCAENGDYPEYDKEFVEDLL